VRHNSREVVDTRVYDSAPKQANAESSNLVFEAKKKAIGSSIRTGACAVSKTTTPNIGYSSGIADDIGDYLKVGPLKFVS